MKEKKYTPYFINRIFFSITTILFIFASALQGMEEGDEIHHTFPNNRKIGVEIETSLLKVSLSGGENIYSGFLIKKEGNPLWAIEQDTKDRVSKKSGEKEFIYNLEAKTLDGFSEPSAFLDILHILIHTLQAIYSETAEPPHITILSKKKLKEWIKEESGENCWVGAIFHGQKEFKVKRNFQASHIRPQLTYQVPFSDIPKIFQRLGGKIRPIEQFLNSLNKEGYRLKIRDGELTIHQQNSNNIGNILNYFNTQLHPHFATTDVSENVKGFSYLFLYYWLTIFNNNKAEKKLREPGPKPDLLIMSRISFSQMYEKGLTSTEQEEFCGLFQQVMESKGEEYSISVYLNYQMHHVNSRLTLKKWYNSIIAAPANGRRAPKILADGNKIIRIVDLLSPPRGMPEHYSMGLFDWEATHYPLLEVRGYAPLAQAANINLDKIYTFIKDEVEWFKQ